MTDTADTSELKRRLSRAEAVAHYNAHILEQMQGRVFYCENTEGVLCRWRPSRPMHIDTEGTSK